jgi:hypothetical protein
MWYQKLTIVSEGITLTMKAVSTSEMSVSFYETTGHIIPEDSPLCLKKHYWDKTSLISRPQ